MKKAVFGKVCLLLAFCFALSALTFQLPATCYGDEYPLTIDVCPNIINIASERVGEIRILTRMRYSFYISEGEAIFVYFNDSDSVQDIRATRDSLGNLILRFGLEDLLAVQEALIPDALNDVTVVVVMDNGDEYIGFGDVYIVDKKAP